MKLKLLSIFFLLFYHAGFAQDKSNKGKEFWLGYGHNVLFTQDNPVNSQTHVIYLSTELPAVVTVSVYGSSWSQTVNIPANSVNFSVVIPKSGAADARLLSEGLFAKGIYIKSDVPIVAYSHQYGLFSSAATMLMPVETFGYTYYSLNYTQVSNYPDSYSWFYVVASEDNTRIQITTSEDSEGGIVKGVPLIVNMKRGEIYNVFGKKSGPLASNDLTGSKIVSVTGADGNCHPIAVFSGSSRNIICNGNGGEILQQQIFPANAWGTKYITYHTVNNAAGNITQPFLNIYRIAVRNPNTIVKRNGVVLTNLMKNFYYEFNSNSGDLIESDQPILVAQFTVSANECTGNATNPIGDPEMIYLSPIEQGVKNAIFYNTRNQDISLGFVNMIIHKNGISSLKIDNLPIVTSEYIPHPVATDYVVVVKRLTGIGAQHSISSDSSFIATNYGVGVFESYGYNVGTKVNNLDAFGSIKNTQNFTTTSNTFTCSNTSFNAEITVAYQLTNIHWKLSQVPGLSPNLDVQNSAPTPTSIKTINGRKYYQYILAQELKLSTTGTYQLPVTYTAPDIDNCNNTETTLIEIKVQAPPSTDFTFDVGACAETLVHFKGVDNLPNFTINKHLWNFEDLTTINTMDCSKSFATGGTQQVKYQVFADNGCVGETTKSVEINSLPIAQFEVEKGCANVALQFKSTSTISVGNIEKWFWDFGDGHQEIKTDASPISHVYTTAGNFVVTLSVQSDKSCNSKLFSKQVEILPTPTAKFSTTNKICLGQPISLQDLSAVGQGITNWHWDFGDGNVMDKNSGNDFDYNYSIAGNFQVSLIVSTANGCKSPAYVVPIQVSPKPTTNFTFIGKPCMDSAIQFTSATTLNSNEPATWYWDFGDGQIFSSTQTNTAVHKYSSAAENIIVKHSVTTGCASGIVSQTIPRITKNPTIEFPIDNDKICSGQAIKFSATADMPMQNWQWDFQDVKIQAQPPVEKQFKVAGNYTISLVAYSTLGCGSNLLKKDIKVGQTPNINAGPDLIVQKGMQKIIAATSNIAGENSYLWTPGDFLNDAKILNPEFTATSNIKYQLTAINKESNCTATDEMEIRIVEEIFVPSAFTPNGDGKNDLWRIPALETYPNSIIRVFNRYGELVYSGTGLSKGWDGTYKGKPLPTGGYVYIIQPTNNPIQNIQGTLMLIR